MIYPEQLDYLDELIIIIDEQIEWVSDVENYEFY